MNDHTALANALFTQGYSCAQAVFGAFCQELHIPQSEAVKLSASFGGGIGRLREVCGALSGALMALGALYASDDPAGKSEHYARVQTLAGAFRDATGSLLCRELLQLDHQSDPPTASERTTEFYQARPCARLVETAVQLLDQYIDENPLPEVMP